MKRWERRELVLEFVCRPNCSSVIYREHTGKYLLLAALPTWSVST